MPKQNHYTPPLKRFLVTVLYHQAKLEHLPMTVLVKRIVEQTLQGKEAWKRATEQHEQPPTPAAHIVRLAA